MTDDDDVEAIRARWEYLARERKVDSRTELAARDVRALLAALDERTRERDRLVALLKAQQESQEAGERSWCDILLAVADLAGWQDADADGLRNIVREVVRRHREANSPGTG